MNSYQCGNRDCYSITSLASAKKFVGSSMPVAFAILRLMTLVVRWLFERQISRQRAAEIRRERAQPLD